MRFYDYALAPSPRKVRLFTAEKGLSIPTVEVDLRARAQLLPQFLAKNPGATVPVLELDDGTCLTESLAICHDLERVQPDPDLFGHATSTPRPLPIRGHRRLRLPRLRGARFRPSRRLRS